MAGPVRRRRLGSQFSLCRKLRNLREGMAEGLIIGCRNIGKILGEACPLAESGWGASSALKSSYAKLAELQPLPSFSERFVSAVGSLSNPPPFVGTHYAPSPIALQFSC